MESVEESNGIEKTKARENEASVDKRLSVWLDNG